MSIYTNHRKIMLIGPMGAGKTSLGKRLAAQLKWCFVDTDHVICQKTGVDIPTIFHSEGEQGFRKREHEALLSTVQASGDAVVACGGGIILRPENRRLLGAQFLVVFLDTSVPRQLERIRHDRNRPLAQRPDLKEYLIQMREERLAFYEGLADIRLDTDSNRFHLLLQQLHQQVLQWL